MIICDTREKKNQHILDYLSRSGISYEIAKLDTGDYMDSDDMTVSVDRKQNLEELRQNLCSHDSSRFWREVRRSKEERIKLIVLVEDGSVSSLDEVKTWRSKYTKVTGQWLHKEIIRCHIGYGVEFLFCQPNQTGKRIVELLGGGK